jgi:hypothetical protein
VRQILFQPGEFRGARGLLDARPDSLETKLRNIRELVENRMKDIRGMLNSDPARVRAEFAKHTSRKSRWSLAENTTRPQELGIWWGLAVSMVPGARIELATPAFSGRRSTTELPRPINNLQDTNSDWCQYWCQFAFSSQPQTNYEPCKLYRLRRSTATCLCSGARCV